ncbi:MAG: response regulator [Deltaproteobacteria bacterium]|jgi:signal transduction histidine kinase/DNA-binding response OmpR family regulator|nr:response regulator [Deltaproteobacteria bacterium]
MKLHLKIFALLMAIVAGTVIITVISSMYYFDSGLQDTIQSQLRVIGQLGEKIISSEIELLKSQASLMGEHLHEEDQSHWNEILERDMRQYHSFIGAAVYNETTALAYAGASPPPPDFYSSNCYHNSRTGWDYITTTKVTKNNDVVFYICSFLSKDQVLVVTVPGLHFTHIIKNYRIWETGAIFIFDEEGVFIAGYHEWAVRDRSTVLQPVDHPVYGSFSTFALKAMEGGVGWGSFELFGKTHMAVYNPISAIDAGWILAVSAPIEESPGGYMMTAFLFMAAIFLGFGTVAAILTTLFIGRQFRVINRQNQNLAELHKLAKSVSESKTNYLASMSHEMRTPLNAIVGFSELILNGLTPPEEIETDLTKIHRAGVTLLGIVNNILDISKIESGKLELIIVKYDLVTLINDIVSLNVINVGQKEIDFKLKVDPELPCRLIGDELRIKQICNNFLTNAFKFTNYGTVELDISSENIDDVIWLIIRVMDTGIGIKSEDLDKLFSAYNQLDLMSNRNILGTGLGLSITKKLVELMDGKIDVFSEYGKGSIFKARIKQKFVSQEKLGEKIAGDLMDLKFVSSKDPIDAAYTPSDLSYANVLVVDDVQTNIDVAKGMAKPYKVNIYGVRSGIEAINLIKMHKIHYDAIFMDHMMPLMDGIETVQKIRHEIGTQYAREIPIIALTANALAVNEKLFLDNGFQAYLPKPVHIEDLHKIMERWVRNPEKEKALGLNKKVSEAYPKEEEPSNSYSVNWQIPGLDMVSGLKRFNGDMEVYKNTLTSYEASAAELLSQLHEPKLDSLNEYMIAVHGIKSSSLAIGAKDIGMRAEELELAASLQDLDTIIRNNSDFTLDLEKLIANIHSYLDSHNKDKAKASMDAPDAALLERLSLACQNYDMDGVDSAMDELKKYTYENDPELVDWLKKRVELMEFDEIVSKLKTPLKAQG